MLTIWECRPADELFTHVDDTDGVTRMFNTTRLASWARLNSSKVEHLIVDIDPDFVQFILTRRGVVAGRLDRMREPYLTRPILGVEMADGSTLTVDGHHRMVILHHQGRTTYKMTRVPLGRWDKFLVKIDEKEIAAWYKVHDKTFRCIGRKL